MIGEIVILHDAHYVMTNDQGTLERLPNIPWWRELQIAIVNHFNVQTIGQVRSFYKNHCIPWRIL